jgi:hypothetical protein
VTPRPALSAPAARPEPGVPDLLELVAPTG